MLREEDTAAASSETAEPEMSSEAQLGKCCLVAQESSICEWADLIASNNPARADSMRAFAAFAGAVSETVVTVRAKDIKERMPEGIFNAQRTSRAANFFQWMLRFPMVEAGGDSRKSRFYDVQKPQLIDFCNEQRAELQVSLDSEDEPQAKPEKLPEDYSKIKPNPEIESELSTIVDQNNSDETFESELSNLITELLTHHSKTDVYVSAKSAIRKIINREDYGRHSNAPIRIDEISEVLRTLFGKPNVRYSSGSEKPEWFKQGACVGLDPNLFFPDDDDAEGQVDPKAVCVQCSIQEDCLEYALENRITEGVWGGASERERRRILRNRRRVALKGA